MATRIPRRASTMRKSPRQARSRVTIDAILDAAARVLGERGWSGLTTNAVAEVAGVSIGSLYQYFPNKLALIEAVRRRHFDEVIEVLRAGADTKRSRERRIAAFVDGMIAAHSRYPDAYRVLIEGAPRGKDSQGMHDAFAAACRSGYEAIFRVNARGIGSRPLVSSQVLAGAIAGAVHEAAHDGTLASPILRQEVLTLVDAYLSRRRVRDLKTGVIAGL